MALRVLCRSHGGENQKGRPSYYSKLLGLASFLRALDGTDVSVTFLNNGPIPAERLTLMQDAGEIVELPGVPMRRSYWAALRHATSGAWPDDDFVLFAEDDYLYHPEALRRLQLAADSVSEADYLTLYGSTPRHRAWPDDLPEAHRPAGWRHLSPWTVDGQDWVRILSTTSSFGARVGTLRKDLGIFRFCMVPHRRMYRDDDTLLVVQGFEPYSYARIGRAAVGLSPGGPKDRLRSAALAPFRLATNLRAHRRPTRQRLLLAADPNLATHMEVGWLAPGRDWPRVAEETVAWGRARGLLPQEAVPH